MRRAWLRAFVRRDRATPRPRNTPSAISTGYCTISERHQDTSGELSVPISTVRPPARLGGNTVAGPRPTTIGMLSTYPPTQCGLATFSAALVQHLHLVTGSLGVVQVVDDAEARTGPDVVAQL